MSEDLALRHTACFSCGRRALRVVKILLGAQPTARYVLECMICSGHGDITLVTRAGEPVRYFTVQSWGPSDTPPQIHGEHPLR